MVRAAVAVESSQRHLQMKWMDKLAVAAMVEGEVAVLAPGLMIQIILSRQEPVELAVAAAVAALTNQG